MPEERDQQADAVSDAEQTSAPDDSEPTAERQAELRKVYETNVAVGKPPYAGVEIGSRGELKWVLRERGWDTANFATTRTGFADLRDIGVKVDLSSIDLLGANLSGMLATEANFSGANLTLANLSSAAINNANFSGANLSLANLSGAVIAGTSFNRADLAGTNLSKVFLAEANFSAVNLNGANLSGATLGESNFSGADLSATNLSGALVNGNLGGATLILSRMDGTTVFGGYAERGGVGGVQLDATTRLLDVSWNGAVLALVNWDDVPRLGDEADIKEATTRKGRIQAYQDTARAYRGLAKALDAQGLATPALRYRTRQHQLERQALLFGLKPISWLFSCVLNIVSGYGDRPLRALGVYLAVVFWFAGLYFGITTPSSPIFFGGSQPLNLQEAMVLSLSSFHGRGFFPQNINLGDPVALVAAIEAVFGLFIELVLIATFTRRLFER